MIPILENVHRLSPNDRLPTTCPDCDQAHSWRRQRTYIKEKTPAMRTQFLSDLDQVMIESRSLIFEDKLGGTARQLVFFNKDVTVDVFNLVADIFLWGFAVAIPATFYLN